MTTKQQAAARSLGRAHARRAMGGFGAQAAFAAGNWADAALHGRSDEGVAHWAGRARCGLAAEAMAALAGLGGDEARYQEGVAAWLLQDEARALRLWRPLAERGDARAGQLVGWLQGHRQLPIDWITAASPGSAGDLLPGMVADDRFSVQQLGLDAYDPQQPLPHERGVRPALWTGVHMLEWCGLPGRVGAFPGKVFGFTSDFDLHVAQLYPTFQALDALVVLDGTEWAELADLTDRPVITLPNALGLTAGCTPQTAWGDRPWDVFISGTQVHSYHPDKALLAHRVAAHFGDRLLGFNGWMSRLHYLEFLRQARVTYTHYRRPGGTVTRGLEALGCGLGVAVQEESILRLHFGTEDGLTTYRTGEPEDLVRALEALLARPAEEAERAAQQGARRVQQRFGLAAAGAHVARMLTVQAAECTDERGWVQEEILAPKRLVLSRGWVAPAADRNVAFDRCLALWERWQGEAEPALRPMISNQLLREITLRVLDALGVQRLDAFSHPQLFELGKEVGKASGMPMDALALAQSYVDQARQNHPQHLTLQFNALRLELVLGLRPLADTLAWGGALLGQNAQDWQVDPLDDPISWDVWSHAFDYRGWVDASVSLLQGREDDLGALTRRLLAGIAHHLHEAQGGDLGLVHLAHELVPDFAPYSLALAKGLLDEDEEARRTGVAILAELSQGSSNWPVARHQLAHHLLRHPEDAAQLVGQPLGVSRYFSTNHLEHVPRF